MTDLLDRLQTALPDRYRIERELDRGALAVVFLVHDQKLNRPALLKVLRPDRATSLDAKRFLQEIGAAGKLRHPNILAPYRYGAAGGLLYYVMPFMRGESLRRRLDRETRLSIEDATEIARQVAAALVHAHGQDMVHRDIRPENILLPEGQALVADFGFARAVRMAAGARSETALWPGKPYYMSPEQVLGDEVGARSDLYSLGATLFEVVTGEKPFEGETVQKIVAQHIANPVREPQEVVPDVPTWLSDLIVRCLQKAPEDRFQGADELLQALETGSASFGSAGGGSAAAEELGVGEIVQGAGWEFDELIVPEVKPPPQPIYDLGPVEQSAPAPEPEAASPPAEPAPSTPEPITSGGDLIPGAWFETDQAESLAKPAPKPAVEKPAEVAASTGDVVEAEAPIEAEPAEPVPEAPVTKPSRIPPWLTELYDWGPELLVRLARKRETWYYVAGGAGAVLLVVLLWIAVKSIFFAPPSVHYQFIRNALVESVQILVDGRVVHTLQPGQQDSMILPKGRSIELSWRLIRPRQGRVQMGEEFEAVLSTAAGRGEERRSAIAGVGPDRAMFAPRITNQTNRELVALVNRGTPAELRCNCVIPPNSRDVHIGYYPLFENSTIRFFDARRAYRGQFQEIGDFAARVDTLSGSVGITIGRF